MTLHRHAPVDGVLVLGFTGTRSGMSKRQRLDVEHTVLQYIEARTFHHGDCLGADAEFHAVVRETAAREHRPCTIHAHPGLDPSRRAFCEADAVAFPAPYLERNARIVRLADLVLATPAGPERMRGSGTWATVRQAVRTGVPCLIFWPDGPVSDGAWRPV